MAGAPEKSWSRERLVSSAATRWTGSPSGTGVAAIFLSRLMNGKPPLVFEDGVQSRDFIHVRDIARASLLAIESADPGQKVYTVDTG
jgi:dTDP-L-rhamnose 4-epimerase